jgi:hypothetical protein
LFFSYFTTSHGREVHQTNAPFVRETDYPLSILFLELGSSRVWWNAGAAIAL